MSENAPGSTSPMSEVDGIRCSDAEREQVRAALFAAAGEGRLTMDEVEERLGRLEEARFRHELAGLTADLPTAEPEALKGWHQILAAARGVLAADLAVMRGRAPEPTSGRRRLLMIVAIVAALLVVAALVVGAVHGFGADGFEHHGMDAVEHGQDG